MPRHPPENIVTPTLERVHRSIARDQLFGDDGWTVKTVKA